MKKITIFQSFDDGNKDCGLACLAMITGKSIDHFRSRFGIRSTRNTKKKEILAELEQCGYCVSSRGRISGKTRLADLQNDALIFGTLDGGEREYGHWAVWDASRRVLRDPNGYRAPYRVSWYAMLVKK